MKKSIISLATLGFATELAMMDAPLHKAIVFDDVLHDETEENNGGTLTEFYYAFPDEIATWAEAPASPTSPDELIEWAGPFTFNTGACWKKLYCTLEEGKVESNLVGEFDGKSFENVATVFIPGSSPEKLGFIQAVKNKSIILLIPERDGRVRLIGTNNLPAKMDTATPTTGAKVADRKGSMITFKSMGLLAPVYTGVITLTPAA